jgi:hypothetical protein
MRHDRDERMFVELAKRFPATVTFATRGSSAPWAIGTLVDPLWVLTAGTSRNSFNLAIARQ